MTRAVVHTPMRICVTSRYQWLAAHISRLWGTVSGLPWQLRFNFQGAIPFSGSITDRGAYLEMPDCILAITTGGTCVVFLCSPCDYHSIRYSVKCKMGYCTKYKDLQGGGFVQFAGGEAIAHNRQAVKSRQYFLHTAPGVQFGNKKLQKVTNGFLWPTLPPNIFFNSDNDKYFFQFR